MQEITVRIGYKFLLQNPRFAWYVYNLKLDSADVMQYFLQSVGERIFNTVRVGDSFTLHIVGENKSKSFVLKRLADGNVWREEEGVFGKTHTEVFSVNLKMTATGQKFAINHYYAGGGGSSVTKTMMSGAKSAISSFTGYVSGMMNETQQGISNFKDQFDVDKKIGNFND
jgi:hypothetical protein